MEENINEQYLKGFNNAYFLAKHDPELLDNLLTIENDNHYIMGMNDGRSTYEKEKSKSRMNELERLESRDDREREK